MTYFAIGESTGGAGERRLGPFETPEEAAQAGRKETKDSNGAFVFKGVVDEANNQVGMDIEPIVSTNSVVMNALAANRRVAKNAMTVEQQREFQKTKLPKIEATISAFEKDCESIHKQVMAALKKADGVASVVSALEKKAESLKKPYHDALIVSDFDEAKSNELYKRVEQAQKKITACRDMASRIGYDIVNSFRVY